MPVLSVDNVPQPQPEQTPRQRAMAIVLVCCAVLCFTGIDAGAKWLNPRLGSTETTFLRYLSGFLWVLPFLNPWRVPGVLVSRKPLLQMLRGTLLLASTALNFVAIQYLQLAQTVSIMFLAPLIVSLAAGPLLGEWVGPRRLIAIFIGFVGVIVITRPGSGAIHPAALLSVCGMLCYATILLMTRRLSAVDSPETTMFYSSLLGVIVLLPVAFMVWRTPQTAFEWLVVAIIGLCGSAGHWLLIQAQRFTDASLLAPFLYSQIVWMTAAGYIFFGELPDRWTFVGSAIVVASGLYVLHRERVRAKEAKLAAGSGSASPPSP